MNYVIYRSVRGGFLEYEAAKNWDGWISEFFADRLREVCRVETIAEAINLTMLANSPDEGSEDSK